jgi:hypothetical protein
MTFTVGDISGDLVLICYDDFRVHRTEPWGRVVIPLAHLLEAPEGLLECWMQVFPPHRTNEAELAFTYTSAGFRRARTGMKSVHLGTLRVPPTPIRAHDAPKCAHIPHPSSISSLSPRSRRG